MPRPATRWRRSARTHADSPASQACGAAGERGLGHGVEQAAGAVGAGADQPGEVQVGIVTAVLGGPVFVALVRRRGTAGL